MSDILTETILAALCAACYDRLNKLEGDEFARSGDPHAASAEADALFDLMYKLQCELIDNHETCNEGEGCELCEREFGIRARIPDVVAVNSLRRPPPGSWAETAFIMADIVPDYDWDAWKDRMKEEML